MAAAQETYELVIRFDARQEHVLPFDPETRGNIMNTVYVAGDL